MKMHDDVNNIITNNRVETTKDLFALFISICESFASSVSSFVY